MANPTWIELSLTERGKRQPIDHLVRQLHKAGFVARRVRDFCTSASEKEFYLENLATDSLVNGMIACGINNQLAYKRLRLFLEGHSHFFQQLPDERRPKSGSGNSYLLYLLAGIYHSNLKAIHSARFVRRPSESRQTHDADWKAIDSTLRPYQVKAKQEILNAWNKVRHVMMQMPTGTGKTRLFVSLIADIRKHAPDAKVLIVTHRKELVEQISHSLTCHYRLAHGILSGSRSKNGQAPILVSSIQTLDKRMRQWRNSASAERGSESAGAEAVQADYIIVDEAHHVLAPSYRQLWQVYPEASILGVTATPCRMRRAPFNRLFDTLIASLPVRDFIDGGYLADYRYYTVSNRMAMIQYVNRLNKFTADGDYPVKELDACCNNDETVAFLADCYETYAAGKKGIVYAVNQSHGERIAGQFRRRGIAARAIDCKTPAKERAQALAEFREGKLKVLVNVELFTEGFDCPSIEFVLLARPTRSLALYLQQVGRALRPSPTGEEVLILDAAGLHGRFGLPDRERDWAAHFQGEKCKKENYNRPLGYAGVSSDSQPMIAVSRNQAIAPERIEKTPHEWSICHLVEKQNLLNKHGRTILKRHLLLDLKREEDGNYSAWLGTRQSGCENRRFIRFTPELALIPDHEFDVNGCKLYAFQPGRAGGCSAAACEAFHKREYTLSLDLESPRYSTVYSWNTDWAVMRLNSMIFHYTGRNVYPEAKECKVSSINDEPFFFTQDFIVGKESSSHFYRRLPHGLYLYYRREGQEEVLYNAQLEPIWRGRRIEVLNEGVILHPADGRPQKISYMDIIFGQAELAGA